MAIDTSYSGSINTGADLGRIAKSSVRSFGNETSSQSQASLGRERPNIERGNKVNIDGRTYDRASPRGTYIDIMA